MTQTRRDLLKTAAAAAAASALGTSRLLSGAEPKTLLILGGTRFLGPEVVEAAKKSGWKISLFNRGKSHPDWFPELEHLQGDRNGDLKSLEGRTWDAVVDTSGYFPKQVAASAALLSKSKQYVFISSISVFSDMSKPGIDESSPVGELKDPNADKITEGNYGPLKAACERAAEAAMPGRVTNVRPGLIVGPNDVSDRFTYWPVRVAKGGEVLAPNTPKDPVQFIDVRDLGNWIVKCLDTKTVGVFNATGNPLARRDAPRHLQGDERQRRARSPGRTPRSSRRRRSPRGATSPAGSRRRARTRTGMKSRTRRPSGRA